MDPLRISMVGLSRWESVFVQTTVDLASGMDIAPWRFVDDPDGADVLLVDADRRGSVSGKDRKLSRHPIVVSFSADPDSASDLPGRGLTRPVGYTDLIAVLKDIETELKTVVRKPAPAKPAPTKPAPTKPAPTKTAPAKTVSPSEDPPGNKDQPEIKDAPAPKGTVQNETVPVIWEQLFDTTDRSGEQLEKKARPARRFVEGTRFLGLLRRILQWRAPAEVTHARFPRILVFPEQSAFLSSGDPTAIPRMFRDSALSFTVRELAEDVAATSLSRHTYRPLSQLLYCAALFGSEGRLLLHCNPEDRLRLIDWPDFNGVPHLPEHREVAKFMLVNAASLSDIARATSVSISIVVDFCNACEAVGLVRRIPPGTPEPLDDIVDRGGSPLFGRVRDLFKEP